MPTGRRPEVRAPRPFCEREKCFVSEVVSHGPDRRVDFARPGVRRCATTAAEGPGSGMKLRMRSVRPSPAMAVALLALFVALGGSAMAARGLITGAQIKDGSVTGADIADDSLRGADVPESSLAQAPKSGNESTELRARLANRFFRYFTRAEGSFTKVSAVPGLGEIWVKCRKSDAAMYYRSSGEQHVYIDDGDPSAYGFTTNVRRFSFGRSSGPAPSQAVTDAHPRRHVTWIVFGSTYARVEAILFRDPVGGGCGGSVETIY